MGENLSASEVWHGTIAVVRRHFGNFAVIAGLTVFLPALFSRFAFPELMDDLVIGNSRATVPSGYWLWQWVYGFLSLIGLSCIAAVAADPDEVNEQTLAANIRGVLPAIGKGVLAGLFFVLVYLLAAIVVWLVISLVMFFVIIIGSDGAPSAWTGGRTSTILLGLFLLVVVLPLMIWASARLSPLTGVYLREPVGVLDGIKRAWALSNGSAWAIVGLALIVAVLTFVLVALQYALARLGFVGGAGGLLVGVVLGVLGALLFVCQAAGLGFLYRRMVEREGAALAG